MPCRLLFLLASLFTTTLSAQPPGTAQVRGRVTARSESPIPGAEITLLGIDRSVMSDSSGRFLLRDLASGKHLIRVRRIGFRAQYLSATLAAGEDKEVAIVLEPGSYELPEITTGASSPRPSSGNWYGCSRWSTSGFGPITLNPTAWRSGFTARPGKR